MGGSLPISRVHGVAVGAHRHLQRGSGTKMALHAALRVLQGSSHKWHRQPRTPPPGWGKQLAWRRLSATVFSNGSSSTRCGAGLPKASTAPCRRPSIHRERSTRHLVSTPVLAPIAGALLSLHCRPPGHATPRRHQVRGCRGAWRRAPTTRSPAAVRSSWASRPSTRRPLSRAPRPRWVRPQSRAPGPRWDRG